MKRTIDQPGCVFLMGGVKREGKIRIYLYLVRAKLELRGLSQRRGPHGGCWSRSRSSSGGIHLWGPVKRSQSPGGLGMEQILKPEPGKEGVHLERGINSQHSAYIEGEKDTDVCMCVHIAQLSPQRVPRNISTPVAVNILLVPGSWFLFIFLFFSLFGYIMQHVRSQFPEQGLNLCSLQWKHGILTTGPPRNSVDHGF